MLDKTWDDWLLLDRIGISVGGKDVVKVHALVGLVSNGWDVKKSILFHIVLVDFMRDLDWTFMIRIALFGLYGVVALSGQRNLGRVLYKVN